MTKAALKSNPRFQLWLKEFGDKPMNRFVLDFAAVPTNKFVGCNAEKPTIPMEE